MRIVAGKFKGVVLNDFDLDNIRPTTDKVREAIFSKIQFDISDSDWLDLFGGTGAVGLEAISRGAKSCIVCEPDKDTCKLIEKNYSKCKIKPDLIKMNFIKSLEFIIKNNKKFDFIFLDPPFATNYGEKTIKKIAENSLLKDDGVIIYEHAREMKDVVVPENYNIIDTKNYGTIAVTYIKKGNIDV